MMTMCPWCSDDIDVMEAQTCPDCGMPGLCSRCIDAESHDCKCIGEEGAFRLDREREEGLNFEE